MKNSTASFSTTNLPPGFYTYAYLRENGTPWYVGKGCGRRAWRTHGTGKHRWEPPSEGRILILKAGLDEQSAFRHEAYLIAVLGNAHTDGGLLRANFTDGGEGISGYRHDEAARKAISAAHKGKPKSAEHSAKVSAALQGVSKSDEHKAALSLARKNCKGSPHTTESKAKISAANKGKRRTPEHCKAHGQRISALAAAKYGLSVEAYQSLSRQHRINMSAWLKRKEGRTPAQYVELYGAAV